MHADVAEDPDKKDATARADRDPVPTGHVKKRVDDGMRIRGGVPLSPARSVHPLQPSSVD